MKQLDTLERYPGLWASCHARTSYLAPQAHFVQALTRNGQTASGAALTRDHAVAKCLGETAEIWALATEHDQPKAADFLFETSAGLLTTIAQDHRVLGSEGVAAGPDRVFASVAAVLERIERATIADWWNQQATPRRLSDAWCHDHGIAALVDYLRQGALRPRYTGLVQLTALGAVHVVIAHSTDDDGSWLVMGYAADLCPVAAAHRALLEMMLMEFQLMDAEAQGMDAADPKLVRLRQRQSAIDAGRNGMLGEMPPAAPPPSPVGPNQKLKTLAQALRAQNLECCLLDITTNQTKLVVVRAVVPGLASCVGLGDHDAPGPMF